MTRISALLTITNAPTTNGQTLVVNSSTRTWTNNSALNPAIYIQTNATIGGSVTNLFQHLAQYRFVSSLNVTYAGTNALKLQAAVNQPLSVSAGGSWASITYITQLVSTPFTVPVRVPFEVEVSSNATTIAELLLKGLNDFSTSRAFTNWTITSPTYSGLFTFADGQAVSTATVHTNYTISTNDFYIGVNSRTNTVPITLPAATNTAGQIWVIHDDAGAGATNAISLVPASGDWINGATNYAFNANYEGALIISRGGTNFYVYATGSRMPSNIPRANIAAGTAAHIVINDGSGNLSSEATLGAARFPALTGDVTTSAGSLATTIAANAVALGTDTTGNYVADVAGTANEVSVSHTPAEGSTATISLPAVIDLGAKTSLEIPNSAAPATTVFGQIAGDNNAWASGHGAVQFFDGTTNTFLLGTLTGDTPAAGQVPKWNADGTITWENDTSGGAGQFYVNGTGVADGNFTNTSTFIWGVDGSTNVSGYPTNLANAQISASAAIARSKIAAGTANHVLINDGSGNLSSEAQLALSRGGTAASLADPNANAFILWDDTAGSNRFATLGTGLSYAAGVVSSTASGGVSNYRSRRTSLIVATGSTVPTALGDIVTETGTQGNSVGDSTSGANRQENTAASSDSDSGVEGNAIYRTGRNIDFSCAVTVQAITDVRFVCGVINQTLATAVDIDNPAGSYAAFQFSTGRADSNWQAITKDGSTQNVTDTTVAADTSRHVFRIVFDDSAPNVKFYIDGTLRVTATSNLPAANTQLRYVVAVETQIAAGKVVALEWIEISSDR